MGQPVLHMNEMSHNYKYVALLCAYHLPGYSILLLEEALPLAGG